MKKSLLVLLSSMVAVLVYANEAITTSPVYINLNTGFATMSNLPTGLWAGALNVGYNFHLN